MASVVPAIPDRSIVNSVAYRDADSLAAALDELAAEYDEAGVEAWTVWVPEDDRDAARCSRPPATGWTPRPPR